MNEIKKSEAKIDEGKLRKKKLKIKLKSLNIFPVRKLRSKVVSEEIVLSTVQVLLGGKTGTTVKGNGGFGDYSAAGEFEVWGEDHRATDGEDHLPGPPRGLTNTQSQNHSQGRCNDGNVSSLRPLLHVAHCELHSPRDAELLRLDQLENINMDRKGDRDPYSMMDNFHSPVPPPLPRRHGR